MVPGISRPLVFDDTCGTFDPDLVPDGELPPEPVGVAMVNYLDYIPYTVTSPSGLPSRENRCWGIRAGA